MWKTMTSEETDESRTKTSEETDVSRTKTSEETDVSRTKIKFLIEGNGEAEGELVRFLAPRTIDMILRKLPIEGRAALWKEEVYFETPIKMGEEKAKGNVENGTIAFWPMGSAVCIFYGLSQPYSRVNILGKVTKNLDVFKQVKSGTKIRIEALVNQGTLPPQV
jgi:hypothetical protein